MKFSGWISSIFLFSVWGLPAIAQSRGQLLPSETALQRTHHGLIQQQGQDQPDVFAESQKENARRANAERQLAIKNDTAKLLQMANELQEYVDKTNENILSLEVVKKAEQIEKLARSVREKMKANY